MFRRGFGFRVLLLAQARAGGHVRWGETGDSEGHSGGALVPKGHGLDAGKDFPLVPRQSHSHVQQIPENTQEMKLFKQQPAPTGKQVDEADTDCVLIWPSWSTVLRPACRKLSS